MSLGRVLALFIAGLIAVVVTATLAAIGTAGPPADDVQALDGVEFVVTCRFSHRAPDDPIVFPGQPGLSHGHTCCGNVSTDAYSTAASLRAAATTCDHADDRAAYWAPTLLVDDRSVAPVEAKIYYRRETLAPVRPFPANLGMIGGDSKATSPQSLRITSWDCGDHGGVAPSSTVPTCPDDRSKALRLSVRFPECWDGKNLDSPDHHSHMAYSAAGVCPRTRPVALPSITLSIQYPVTGAGRVELASRGQFSGHADYVNTWRQESLARLVQYCLNAVRSCS
jgi:Domain of unknown function (DUF1996)